MLFGHRKAAEAPTAEPVSVIRCAAGSVLRPTRGKVIAPRAIPTRSSCR